MRSWNQDKATKKETTKSLVKTRTVKKKDGTLLRVVTQQPVSPDSSLNSKDKANDRYVGGYGEISHRALKKNRVPNPRLSNRQGLTLSHQIYNGSLAMCSWFRGDMEKKMRADLKNEQRQSHVMAKKHQGEMERLVAANRHAEAEVCGGSF